jgi:Uma2 family endonuclease
MVLRRRPALEIVIELRPPSDPLAPIKGKMRGYVENGARLGWLIDPEERKVHFYRPDDQVEIADNPDRVSGDPILPGFFLVLKPIWEPGF